MEFKLRDLALLLPDEVGDAESLRYTKDATAMEAPAQMLQPRIDPTKKVVIYRAGQSDLTLGVLADSLSLSSDHTAIRSTKMYTIASIEIASIEHIIAMLVITVIHPSHIYYMYAHTVYCLAASASCNDVVEFNLLMMFTTHITAVAVPQWGDGDEEEVPPTEKGTTRRRKNRFSQAAADEQQQQVQQGEEQLEGFGSLQAVEDGDEEEQARRKARAREYTV
eukprot:1366-Heterococcus_DN1.PRE.2